MGIDIFEALIKHAWRLRGYVFEGSDIDSA